MVLPPASGRGVSGCVDTPLVVRIIVHTLGSCPPEGSVAPMFTILCVILHLYRALRCGMPEELIFTPSASWHILPSLVSGCSGIFTFLVLILRTRAFAFSFLGNCVQLSILWPDFQLLATKLCFARCV